eukprot:1402290-Pyramimonas_sp.AAC.1
MGSSVRMRWASRRGVPPHCSGPFFRHMNYVWPIPCGMRATPLSAPTAPPRRWTTSRCRRPFSP